MKENPMHILLVNDDGIQSRGIHALCKACVERGHEVTLCAPHTERSASSQRITLAEPIYVHEVDFGLENVRAWSISGTPADCVRLGLFDLIDKPVDVVISGINKGHNAGMAVHYSGTIAAAREGALNNVPAIASSIAFKATESMLMNLAHLTVITAEAYVKTDIPQHTLLSINAPLREPEDLLPPVMAPLSTAGYKDSYVRRESPRAGTYFWLSEGCETKPSDPGTDIALLKAGHVTYTVIGNPDGSLDPAFVAQFAAVNPHE
jgi:5'-nucleotidase